LFDAFVGSEREIWIGSDASGLIRESRGPAAFFSESGRSRWEAAGAPALEHDASIDLFAPDCLGGSRRRRRRLGGDPDAVRSSLVSHVASLHDAQELLSEAVVSAEFVREVYEVAGRLAGVRAVEELADQLGRAGRGLVGTMRQERLELVFAADLSELLGYQWFLNEDQPFAAAGTLHSWSAFVERAIVDRLPDGIPPVPQLPCEPRGSGRGFVIRPGFSVMTGYVTDAVAQLVKLRRQGTITDAEYDQAAKPYR
jgi:hypothetical protein